MPITNALFLAANPKATESLALDEEIRSIEDMVRRSKYRDMLAFQSAWAVRPDDLIQQFNERHPHIVHFSGHGSGKDGICLVGKNGEVGLVSTLALKRLFTNFKGNIRLIFLNACYSQEQAQALVEVIDCVIGMNDSISDDAAMIFAGSFYRALAFGLSVQNAFDQGLTALAIANIPEEEIPQLLVKDGVDPNKIVLVGPQADSVKNKQPEPKKSPIEVFISYSRKDKLLRDQLATQLTNLRRQNIIRDWFDGDIVPGTEWKKQIQQHMESAQIILLLISADFMASDFCYSDEMTRVLERNDAGDAIVIPILLRSTDYDGAPFAKLPMYPSDGRPITLWANQDEAFKDIINGIKIAINDLNKKS